MSARVATSALSSAALCALGLALSCTSSNVSPYGYVDPTPRPDGGTAQDAAVAPEAAPALDAAAESGAAESGAAESDAAPLLSVSAAYPLVGSTDACADVHPRLTFSAPVALGAAGRIQLWSAELPSLEGAGGPKVVDSIDIGAASWTTTISGREFNIQRPVWIDGASAVIAFKSQAMTPGGTYFVTVDDGVFVDAASQLSWGQVAPRAWSFTVASRPRSLSALTVASDGSGDFCTVQGAIDAISVPNPTRVTVTIKKGTYREIVFINRKNSVTLHGEDRKETVIAYANNNALNPHTNTRALVEAEGADGLIVENITLKNLTPQGGSQAEALRVEPSDQVILRDADFLSTQDTLLLTGRVYVTNCYVEGNVDFIWGKGTAYFDRCELKTVGRAGYEVQSRNAAGVYGYVFVDSTLTSTPGITGNLLGRVDASVYPASQVAYVNCKMDGHIDPKGWLITGVGADAGSSAGIRFAEYQSTDLAGRLLDVSMRIPESKQLTEAEAATMRDKSVVLAGWNPTPPVP